MTTIDVSECFFWYHIGCPGQDPDSRKTVVALVVVTFSIWNK